MNWKHSFYKKHENKFTNTIKLKTMGEFNWGGLANTALGTGMGLLLEGHNDRRQLQQQGKLQELQIQGQKQMMDYSMMKQMEMWQNTNYEAQMEQIAKAGLNPALLYSKTGGGGTTTGSPSGNVQGATAPQGGMEIMNMMMQRAQIELMKAQAAKTTAEIPNITKEGQNIEASTASLLQGIENAKAQKELTEVQISIASIDEKIKGKTQNAAIAMIMTELGSATRSLKTLQNEGVISDATVQNKIMLIKQELANKTIEWWKTRTDIDATKQGIKESLDRIQTRFQENLRAWDKMSQDNSRIYNETYKEIMNDNAFPKELQDILNGILIMPMKGGKK